MELLMPVLLVVGVLLSISALVATFLSEYSEEEIDRMLTWLFFSSKGEENEGDD